MQTASRAFVLLTVFGACSPATSPTVVPRPPQQEPIAGVVSSRGTRVQSVRPPSLVATRAGQELVYEIVIALPADGPPFQIDRIEVIEGSRSLTSLDAPAIAASMIVRAPDHKLVLPLPDVVSAGQEAVVFMKHELASDAKIADHLLVNVSLKYAGGPTEIAALEVPVLPVAPVVLGPPIRGGPWLAINGLSNGSLHRRTVPPFPTVHVPERYAIDYLLANDAGRIASTPGTKNEEHFAYGKELLAVGDGTIHSTLDGLPDNAPGMGPVAVVTRENIAGNMVMLSLDGGAHVLYAHLVPGSLKVKRDDRVKKGDVLGLLGNSGNSSAAHLHIHVSDRPDALESEGLPFVFESFTYVGKIVGGTGFDVVWGPRASEPQSRLLPREDEANAF